MPVTFEKVQKDVVGFSHDIQMYCYHQLNGRFEEANTYLETFKDAQDSIGKELTPVVEPDEEKPVERVIEIVELK